MGSPSSAFADQEPAFADFDATGAIVPTYHRNRGRKTQGMMKIYYPGVLMIPLVLVLLALAATMTGTGMIQGIRVWSYWPVTLIATGLEELYLWATAGRMASRRVQ